MSFFNFDYDPNNPRVGDRVIVVGDEQLSQMAEANERAVPWFTQHRGGEFYIREIVAGNIYLSSPLTNSIDNYTWSPNWLAPAPTSLPAGTWVMVPEVNMNERYRNNENWCDDMDRYRCHALNVRRPTTNGYFEVDGNGCSWHRDWMFIMPDAQRTYARQPRTRGDFKVGDTVMVLNGHLGIGSFGNKGVITAVGVDHCAVTSSTKPGMNHAISYSRLMLLARDGKLTYEPNDAKLVSRESVMSKTLQCTEPT